MDETSKDQYAVRSVKRGRPPKGDVLPVVPEVADDLAQEYALRIWNGQSPDVPRKERMARVSRGVEAQGMSMEGVRLPDA